MGDRAGPSATAQACPACAAAGVHAGRLAAAVGRSSCPRAMRVVFRCAAAVAARSRRICCPGIDACCGNGGTFGRLEVPGWGANTMRAEFAVLTGIPGERARLRPLQPLSCLCARADRLARLAVARRGLSHGLPASVRPQLFPTGSDTARARLRNLSRHREPGRFAGAPPIARIRNWREHVLRVLDAEGPEVFIFAITMGNHGPWREAGPPIDHRTAAKVRSDRSAARRRVAALPRRSAPVGRDAADPAWRACSAAHRDGVLGVLRRPPSEPAAGLRPFRLRRVGSDYVVWSGRLARPAARSARLRLPRLLDGCGGKGPARQETPADRFAERDPTNGPHPQ